MEKLNNYLRIVACSGLVILTSACNQTPKGDGSLVVSDIDGQEFITCNFDAITSKAQPKLSDFVEDFEIVRFENKDDAFFKPSAYIVTDNYIGVRQSGAPFLLFDKNGKLLNKVGEIGNGPGEYNVLYDQAINEKAGKIYLAPFAGLNKVHEYNMDGSYVRSLTTPTNLAKARVKAYDDGTVSVVHMPFTTEQSPFIAMTFDKNGDSISCLVPTESQRVNPFIDGSFRGFDYECISTQNTDAFDVRIINNDTMFIYDSKANKMLPRFVLNFGEMAEKPFAYANELSNHLLCMVYGQDKVVVLVDKKARTTASFTEIENDFLGNMPVSASFEKGYFIQTFEPAQLMEKLETYLASGNCPESEVKKLEDLYSSLHENDNNVMFIGKIKQ